MSLAAARTELRDRLRADMSWDYGIVSEYETPEKVPVILMLVSEASDDVDILGDTVMYGLEFELRNRPTDTHGVDVHRDFSNAGGLAGALARIERAGDLVCSTVIPQGVEVGVEREDTFDGKANVLWSWVRVECDWYISGAAG